jgi:hypothetical protein
MKGGGAPGHGLDRVFAPHTLVVRANLAYWTGEIGDAAAARDQFAALLPIRERVSGPDHPEALTARANLARWTGRAGNAAAARNQFAALLPIREPCTQWTTVDIVTSRSAWRLGVPRHVASRYADTLRSGGLSALLAFDREPKPQEISLQLDACGVQGQSAAP